jgi:Protein tyrosine and serine/threonine kinase
MLVAVWELVSGQQAFNHMHLAQIIHMVGIQGVRPTIPDGTMPEYANLMRACWAHDAEVRPPFEVVLRWVEDMLLAVQGHNHNGAGSLLHTGIILLDGGHVEVQDL